MICKFCGRTCDSLRSLAQHQLLCKLNPDRRPHTGGAKRGRKAWNKGLKKSTSESVKKYSETISKNYSGENSPWYGKHHTEETKMKLAKSGGYRKGSGRGKRGTYKGYYCDSSWELAFVIYNLENGIEFTRNRKKFKYLFEGKEHYYMPDFVINGSFVEIKGYWTKQWQAKMDQFPKHEKLIVIDKHGISKYLNYAEDKYGKEFIKLYDIV